MLENQLIQFVSVIESRQKEPIVLPLSQLSYRPTDYTRLFAFISGGYSEIAIMSDSDVLYAKNLTWSEDTYTRINLSAIFYEASALLTKEIRYNLRAKWRDTSRYYYTAPIIFSDKITMSNILFRCNEDALTFPFASAGNLHASLIAPVRLHSPQFVQDDKTYVKANGNVITLYAKYYKEWEGETEYLTAEMHEKIVAALSCDEVYIEGKRVTKSDNYQVDWENYDLDCDGVTKLARATFKVRENTNQRNSNY